MFLDYVYKRKPHRIVAIKGEELFHKAAMERVRNYYPQVDKVEYDLDKSGNPCVYNRLHNSWIKFKMEDMIRIDLAEEGDVYPIDATKFEELYEPVEE